MGPDENRQRAADPDERLLGLQADAATLATAEYTPERATTLTARLIEQRPAGRNGAKGV